MGKNSRPILYIACFVQYMTPVGQYARGVLAKAETGQFYSEKFRNISDAVYEFRFFGDKETAEDYLNSYCGTEWEDLT